MLEKICTGLVRGLLGVILLCLTILSAFVTCRVYGGAEIVEYGTDIPLLHLLFCAVMITFVVVGRRLKNTLYRSNVKKEETDGSEKAVPDLKSGENKRRNGKYRRTQYRYLFFFALFYLIWILLVPSWGGSDSHQCMEAAQGLLRGDFRAWEPVAYAYGAAEGPLGYAYTYPPQNGLILYMTVLSFFFGEAAYAVFQILNIGFFLLGIVSLQRLMVRDGEKRGLRLWMACCLPFSFYILFVYGTMPGFGFSCLAMERMVRYVERGHGKDFWIGALSAAAAVLLKSNYEIVLVALFLYLGSSGLFRKNIRLIAASVLLIAVYLVGNRGMQAGISSITGHPVAEGAPMIAWVEMGLEESKRGPGWYNGYQVKLFQQADGDSELASAWAKADLRKTLSDMAENPGKTADFFVRKIESIWAEPTFQSLWIQEVGNTSWPEGSLPWQLFKEEGVLNRLYVFAANLMQTFVYAMACVWVVAGMRREGSPAAGNTTLDSWGRLLPGIVFIGGFVFHLFWEAKGQYSVVYFMLLLPYAYLGMKLLSDVNNRK